MSKLRNTATVIGNVGAQPTFTEFKEGKKVASFSIATKETYALDSGDIVTKTEWHRVSAWGKKADIIQRYVSKGDKIGIEGKLTTRTVEKDGTTYYNTHIEVREIELMNNQKS
jgi:single-strand DNA-binding protein